MSVYLVPMIIQLFIILPVLVLSIYLLVLLIKLTRRGITALDIYIEKNNKKNVD